ncbi:hypothetical protein, partial [Photorhabdus akhurstii]|uniref:hypothetical protein n=1 Tax=Photorhabdus akhurstii TaxID=171438 RepID=UPI00363D348D
IPSVNIPFCCYLTTQGEFTGILPLTELFTDSFMTAGFKWLLKTPVLTSGFNRYQVLTAVFITFTT